MENSNLPVEVKKNSFFSKLKIAFLKIFNKKVEMPEDVAVATQNGSVPVSNMDSNLNPNNAEYFFIKPKEEIINQNKINEVNEEKISLGEAIKKKEEEYKYSQMSTEEKKEMFLNKTMEHPEMFDSMSMGELQKIENHYDLEIDKAEKEFNTLTIVEKIEKDTNLLNMLSIAQLNLVEGYYDRELQKAELELAKLNGANM